MKYYSEEVINNLDYRKNYSSSLQNFIAKEGETSAIKRSKYISPKKYKSNPEKFRQDYKKIIGFNKPKKVNIKVEKNFVALDKNVNIYRMSITGAFNIPFYGILFEPIDKTENTPLIFAFHGGGGTPELVSSINLDSGNYNHMARRMTDRGYAVFCPQFLLWNQSETEEKFDRIRLNGRCMQLGFSITALEQVLVSQCADYFLGDGGYSEDRFGVIGLSYGGMNALTFAAIDTRVKACYSSSWYSNRFTNSWADWSYKGLANRFEDAELAALVCPRALVITMGDKDALFNYKEAEASAIITTEYYKEFNAQEKFCYYTFDGNHETDKSPKWEEFLDKYLK